LCKKLDLSVMLLHRGKVVSVSLFPFSLRPSLTVSFCGVSQLMLMVQYIRLSPVSFMSLVVSHSAVLMLDLCGLCIRLAYGFDTNAG
jgi:hypothetical protein